MDGTGICEEMSHIFIQSLAHTLPGLEMQICCQGTMPDALVSWTSKSGDRFFHWTSLL